jgi:hypothetical protein
MLLTAMFVTASILLFVAGATLAAASAGETREEGPDLGGPALVLVLFRLLLLAAHRPTGYGWLIVM